MFRRLFRHPSGGSGGTAAAEPTDVNVLVAKYLDEPAYALFIAYKLARAGGRVLLFTGDAEWAYLQPALKDAGVDVRFAPWDFGQDVSVETSDPAAKVVFFKMPVLQQHWEELQALRRRFGAKFSGVNELLLPVGVLLYARGKFPYAVKELKELFTYYTGGGLFGANLRLLNQAYPLAGRSAIEFGPLDGSQTAFLVNSGASRVTCVEARPENAMKLIAARQALGWDNVHVRMEAGCCPPRAAQQRA